ncbi:MAG: Unknown protein [uncultured Sulfurovum sp.]|uniref:Sulfatase N-terminal domain-containing protein n=1 Tax=uncultured Sulfurovum sp. TaxID=269237 RepID=A0A6S6RZP4_9BACT|nr:MAG: Unknown protein [uncultured Sulfurovum sp.]
MNFKLLLNNILTFFILLILLMLIQSMFNPLSVTKESLFHFELFDLRGLAKGGIYVFTYLLAVIPLFILVKLKSLKTFLALLCVVFIFLSIDFFIQLLGVSHGFSYDEYTLAMNEAGNYKYLITYLDSIGKTLVLAMITVLIVYFIRQKISHNNLTNRFLFLALVPMFIIYVACYKINTFKLSSYPAMLKIPNIAVAYFQFSKPITKRILEKDIEVKNESKFRNIVWIIDESVTGTYLSVNGYDKKTTPYLERLDTTSSDFVNFGTVNSISNCSANSNLFLRIGMNPKKHELENITSLPTIFQYAKRAGYKTWLFDSQTRKDHLQNHLTIYDKDSIDNFETLGSEVERVQRDESFLNRMLSLVNDGTSTDKNFIVLVKYGAHFPYLLTYDQKFTSFKPVLENSYGGMNFENREKQLNTYLNSLYFNVDLYLKKMLEKIDLKESAIFYTSDHGQNILESEGLSRPHCNNENVVKNEVSVPLFLFSNKAKELFPNKENKFYSQIQMFPTTLSFLGYSSEIVNAYGKTLNEGFTTSTERQYILSSSKESKVYE